MLGPQDLYRVAKETGQLVSNVQTAGTDAWKVRIYSHFIYSFVYLFVYLFNLFILLIY